MDKKKYIDLETAVEILKRKSLMMFNSYYKGYTNAIKDLAEIPAADVQEVVRCKSCQYYDMQNCYCEMFDFDTPSDDFYCREGERKDGEENA